ncbi:MAG: AIDA repeat-containing protein [Victivallales bacterium]|nr:AIDA repeat-containing protein [Victivallales bacterium]
MYGESDYQSILNSGIQTVIPAVAVPTPQIVFLDFDGAVTSYHNRDLDISIDNVTVEDSGICDGDIAVIVDALNAQFGGDVVFTAELPSDGEFSTIYVGVTSAFDEFGDFLGLAETIDSGNQFHDDNAFVLLDSSAPTELVVSVIAHETEHIVHGMEHGGEGLERFAAINVVGGAPSLSAVISFDIMNVYNGGQALFTTVNSGGVMNVSAAGMATNTTVNYCGAMYVYAGMAISTTVNEGDMHVYNAGQANFTTVNYMGLMHVYSAGRANSTTVNDSGLMNVCNSGIATVATVSGGTMYVYSGGIATCTTVNEGGRMSVYIGGVANITTISGGFMEVLWNATANSTTVNDGGRMNVTIGGVANSTTINFGGRMNVYSGGMAAMATVNGRSRVYSGGTMHVYSGGTATSTTVNAAGSMYVYSSGTATSTTMNGGLMNVYSGGTATTTTMREGAMVVSSGGMANNTTVRCGRMYVYRGGIAVFTTLNIPGGSYSYQDGWMSVSSGTATFTTVNSGSMSVSSGGTATCTTVNNGGSLFILEGGNHSGTLQIADGGKVTANSGATIDFTVAEQVDRNIALVNRYDYITGETPAFTITVSGGEEYGRYALAGYASAFNSTVTVKTTAGAQIGALSVDGEAFVHDEKAYSLALDGSTLVLTISDDITPPTVSELVVGKPGKDGTAAISVVANEELCGVQYAWNGGDWTELPVGASLKVSENGSVRFQLTDLAGNVTTTGEYAVDPFNVLLTDVVCETDGNNAIVDWSGDGTVEWSRSYDARLSSNDGVVAMNGLAASGMELVNLPAGDMAVAVKPTQSDVWTELDNALAIPDVSDDRSVAMACEVNGLAEVMFARGGSVWSGNYRARHAGVGEWSGTGQSVELEGKNRLDDVFLGSDDTSLLLLTDDTHGDALFLDDIYSAFPDGMEAQARIAKIDEIRAGAGNDIVDLTSQRFDYIGDGLTVVRGGLGDDVIWANKGDNMLFGDAGDDSIVGASGNDVIGGGAGDDILHGGGGEDIFCFCADWGKDTVEQLATGKVTLWFKDGDDSKWNDDTLTYTDGDNSVEVKGVDKENITRYFGDEGGEMYADLLAAGAFDGFTSEKIFADKNKGMLA